MMRRKGVWLLSIVLLVGLPPAILAESHEKAAPESPPLFFIWTDHVPMANAAAYEAEAKKVMAKMAETEEGKKLAFATLSGSAGYAYIIQLADLADFSKKSQEFMAATMAAGGMEIWDASNALVDHGSAQLVVLRPDLSYTPAEPRAEEATGQVRVHDWWYVRPGHEQAIEEVAKKLVALYTAKNVDTGWRIYQAVTGDDLPLYIVTSTATSPADSYANDERVGAILGEDAQKLLAEATSHARRLEQTMSRVRPDLSMGM